MPTLKAKNLPYSPEWIINWLVKNQIVTDKNVKIVKLAGDGSQRQFFRITFLEKSWVLLVDPEWEGSKNYPIQQSFLSQKALPVPHFICSSPKEGYLLMEDLGNTLLQNHITLNKSQKLEWLEKSTVLLADLHGKTYPVPDQNPATQLRFDKQKYWEELQFTQIHLVEGLLELKGWTTPQKTQLEGFCEQIASFTPKVFCHRDYHTRNLMFFKNNLILIDFQDARTGSIHYDLASLLYDPYVSLSDPERESLKNTYIKHLQLYPLRKEIKWESFDFELKQVALQRLIKAAGSFASFYTRFNKTSHLLYLFPCLSTLTSLLSEPRLNSLMDLLHIEDWMEAVSERSKTWAK